MKGFIIILLSCFSTFIYAEDSILTSAQKSWMKQEKRSYVDVSLGLFNYHEKNQTLNFDDKLDIEYLAINLGFSINPFLSVEGRIAGSAADKSMHVQLQNSGTTVNTDVHVKIRNQYGGYLRAHYPGRNIITPYLIAGYTRSLVYSNVPYLNSYNKRTESDISYGAGIKFNLGFHFDAQFEYMQYFDTDRFNMNGISFSLSKRF